MVISDEYYWFIFNEAWHLSFRSARIHSWVIADSYLIRGNESSPHTESPAPEGETDPDPNFLISEVPMATVFKKCDLFWRERGGENVCLFVRSVQKE